jgi:A/G-specific adenine glycosylase
MDLGATVCTPRRPACGICPWRGDCAAHGRGIEAELPRKVAKAKKPTRHGTVYLALREDGAVLVETRAAKGLLGGMLGLPGGDWDGTATARPPFAAEWRDAGGEVRHTFTHFHLKLRVEVARVGLGFEPPAGRFVQREEALAAAPTVMESALRLGLAALCR